MAYDIVIRGGRIIDGTGVPERVADVAVQGDRIVEIGEVSGAARETIDAAGLVVAPGFVDIHTHYDAQAFWDPALSPSSFHGITTVVCGNCGYSIAPLTGDPADSDYLMRMLARVEGMPIESLAAGVPWNWRSFGEYLAALDGTLALNTAFFVGHSALRRAVMGPRAVGEFASDSEIAAMQSLLRKSIGEGGLGLSSSIAKGHLDGDGNAVPSCHADDKERYALASVLSEFEGTALEFLPNIFAEFDESELARMTNMSLAAKRPLNWNLLLPDSAAPSKHLMQLAASDYAEARGARIYALASCQPPRARCNLISGQVFEILPEWAELLALPLGERMRRLRDPAIRKLLAASRHEHLPEAMRAYFEWDKWTIAEAYLALNKHLEGKTLAELGRVQHKTALDALIDLALSEDLKTSFSPPSPGEDDESWRLRGQSWCDARTVIGGSDAGAHLDMLDTFAFTTKVLGEGVRRRGLLDLPEAVRQMTQVPAEYLGLNERGILREGYKADIVVFDADKVDCGPIYTRYDLPAGAPRLYADAIGIAHVFVNGREIVRGREFLGDFPGRVLRSGTDTHTVSIPGAPGQRI